PEINISANTTLEFWHKYSFEGSSTFYDGAVLEITTNNGSNWQDLGSAMTEGGYNVTLASGNPLGSRSGWGGSNNNYSKVAVDLSAYAGSTAKIRWRFASDVSVGAGDWDIDDIQVLDSSACIPLPDLIFEHGFE
ncbi:MAG: choice-of-anchor J domain-containing protein, partial [Xanthomonadales bacterium]|nr:choice-of-anchor J domain-containing protein [Xanthomonadales bacterium]